MKRRMRIHMLLVMLAFAATVGLIAACSGGGGSHGATPCCGASGSVEQPPPFAPVALFARPFLYGKLTACPDLATFNLDALLGLDPAGKEKPVDAALLTYTVSIDAAAAGKQVAVVVYDKTGGIHVHGIGLIGADIQPNPTGTPYTVAPIRLRDPAAPATAPVGESTLELATLCALDKAGTTGGLRPADVRSVITSSLAAQFVPSTGEAASLLSRIIDMGTVVGDMNAVAAVTQANSFGDFRRDIEHDVDSCAAGDVVAGCASIAPRDLDFYRAARFAAPDASYALDPFGNVAPSPYRYYLHGFIQHLDDRLGDVDPSSGDYKRMSMRLQTESMRYQLAIASIEAALLTPLGSGVAAPPAVVDLDATPTPTAGQPPPSIHQSEAALLAALTLPQTSDTWSVAWTTFAANVAQNVDLQIFDATGVSHPVLDVVNKSFAYASNSQQVLTAQSTFPETLSHLYSDGANTGENDLIKADVEQNTPALATLPAVQHAAIEDLVFFSTASAALLPGGPPAPDAVTAP